MIEGLMISIRNWPPLYSLLRSKDPKSA